MKPSKKNLKRERDNRDNDNQDNGNQDNNDNESLEEIDYSKLSHYKLKKLLKERKLRGTDDRDIATIRLQNYDSNRGNVTTMQIPEEYVCKMPSTSTATIKYCDLNLPFYGVPMNIVKELILDRLDLKSLWGISQTCRNFYGVGSKILCEQFRQFLVQQRNAGLLKVGTNREYILQTGRGITVSSALHGLFGCLNSRNFSSKNNSKVNRAKLTNILTLIHTYGTFENGILMKKELEDEYRRKNQLVQEREAILNAEIAKLGYNFCYPVVVDRDGLLTRSFLDCERPSHMLPQEIQNAIRILHNYVQKGAEYNAENLWYYLALMGVDLVFCPMEFYNKKRRIATHVHGTSIHRQVIPKRQVIIPGKPEITNCDMSPVDYFNLVNYVHHSRPPVTFTRDDFIPKNVKIEYTQTTNVRPSNFTDGKFAPNDFTDNNFEARIMQIPTVDLSIPVFGPRVDLCETCYLEFCVCHH